MFDTLSRFERLAQTRQRNIEPVVDAGVNAVVIFPQIKLGKIKTGKHIDNGIVNIENKSVSIRLIKDVRIREAFVLLSFRKFCEQSGLTEYARSFVEVMCCPKGMPALHTARKGKRAVPVIGSKNSSHRLFFDEDWEVQLFKTTTTRRILSGSYLCSLELSKKDLT
jgi:hypothetical protein